jgi:hypothetical protein
MATATIQFVTGAGTVTFNKTVSAAHLTRLIAAFQAEANTSVGGVATDAQVLEYLATKTFERWRVLVREKESQTAWNSALAGVTDITIS